MNSYSTTLNLALAQDRMSDLERRTRRYSQIHGGEDLEPKASPRLPLPRVRWWQRSDARVSGA